MRDPSRIDRILGDISVLWKANPDWRLTQLIVNVGSMVPGGLPPVPNLFYLEDTKFEEALHAMTDLHV